MGSRMLLVSLLALGAGATAAQAASGPVGTLGQLSGDAGCYSDDGFSVSGTAASGTCTNVRGIRRGYGGALSPDGRFFYVANDENGIAAFSRDPATGVLTQLSGKDGCVTEDGTLPGGDEGAIGCIDGRALSQPISIVVSPDGKNVYAASGDRGEVAAFSRDATTGALTQLDGPAGCLSNDATATGDPGAIGCVDGRSFGPGSGLTAYQIVMAADGRTLYVPLLSGGVVVLRRDPATGALSQPAGADGCVTDDGAATGGDPGGSGCADGRAVPGPASVALSPDGNFAYVQSETNNKFATAIFRVTKATGALVEVGCVTNDGLATGDPGGVGCTNAHAVGDFRVLVSHDGRNVYTTSYFHDQIAVFSRDKDTGLLTQLAGTAGCVSDDGTAFDAPGDPASTCIDARGLNGAYPLVEGPEGSQLIVGGYDSNEWALFTRDPATGALSQAATAAGCMSESGTATGDPGAIGCTDLKGLSVPTEAVMTPDGHSLYLVGAGRAIAAFERQVAPVCKDTSAVTPFGTPVAVTLDCSDANGDALTVTPGTPGHGTVGPVASGKATYTPAAGFSGADSFTFTASDGSVSSAAANAVLGVGAAPKPVAVFPGFASKTLVVARNGSFNVVLTCPAGTTGCAGKLTFRTAKAVAAAKKPRKRVLVLASANYLIAPGQGATLTMRLGKKGRALLRRSSPVGAQASLANTTPPKTKTVKGLKFKRAK